LGTELRALPNVSRSNGLRPWVKIGANGDEDRNCDKRKDGYKTNRGRRVFALGDSLADSHSLFLVHDGILKWTTFG
jgi:hypothetical protein